MNILISSQKEYESHWKNERRERGREGKRREIMGKKLKEISMLENFPLSPALL